MKNVREIVIDYCKSIGADGLCDPDDWCGCELNDMCIHSYDFGNCKPAKLIKCSECDNDKNCVSRMDHEYKECFKIIEDKITIDNILDKKLQEEYNSEFIKIGIGGSFV